MTEKKTAKTKKQTVKKKPEQKSKKAKSDNSNHKKELDLLIDKHVRLKAEFENFRKRKNKEISALLQYDGESVIKEVLPIFDDLNRMVESAETAEVKNEDALINGINLLRSKIGRAYAAIRDRDIAAEAIGINLARYKASAFALSSFYAGVAGALMFSTIGAVDVERFGLLFSVTFIAIVVIGGVGTVMGPIFGSIFFGLMPGIIKFVIDHSEFVREVIPLNAAQIERIIFGLFIVGFLMFEPRGLWGIWFRLRNYFKAWPFSY